jgi:hypothetical protein
MFSRRNFLRAPGQLCWGSSTPGARLSDTEPQELADGLAKTFSDSPPGSG